MAVARLRDGAILARAEPVVGRGHGDVVMDVVGRVLAEAGADYRSVARVAAVVGPGSFTGIRVAIAAAKGLALSLGCEAVGVSALEALAEPHLGRGEHVLAVHDARRGEVFAALYAPDGREVAAPFAAAAERIADVLPRFEGPLALAGSGAAAVLERLPAARLASFEVEASIEAVVRLAARAIGAGAPLQPLYLRGADAKVQTPAGLRSAAPA